MPALLRPPLLSVLDIVSPFGSGTLVNLLHPATQVSCRIIGTSIIVFVGFLFTLFLKRVLDLRNRGGLNLLKCIAQRNV